MQPRQIYIKGTRAALVVKALAEAHGHQIVDSTTAADLLVCELEDPREIEALASQGPLFVVTPKKLREKDFRAFEAAGADRVVDAESSFLSIAFALSELLFSSPREQRQYDRNFGGVAVRAGAQSSDLSEAKAGRLIDMSRPGAFVLAPQVLQDRSLVRIQLDLAGHSVELRGRVAFVDERGFAVEFAQDDQDVAPKLSDLCRDPLLIPPDPSAARSTTATL